MAAAVKQKWLINRYAKFIRNSYDGEPNIFSATEKKKLPEAGRWKHYASENNDMTLSYLEAEHFILTKKDIVLESFSLVNSRKFLRGNAKGDSLMIIHNVGDGSCRRFRIQFSEENSISGIAHCERCIKILSPHFPIKYHGGGTQQHTETSSAELSEIDKELLNKMTLRRAYHMDGPLDHIQETLLLCLTDASFPAYVEAVEHELQNIGK